MDSACQMGYSTKAYLFTRSNRTGRQIGQAFSHMIKYFKLIIQGTTVFSSQQRPVHYQSTARYVDFSKGFWHGSHFSGKFQGFLSTQGFFGFLLYGGQGIGFHFRAFGQNIKTVKDLKPHLINSFQMQWIRLVRRNRFNCKLGQSATNAFESESGGGVSPAISHSYLNYCTGIGLLVFDYLVNYGEVY